MSRVRQERLSTTAKKEYGVAEIDSILDQIDEAIDAEKFIVIRSRRGRPSLSGRSRISPHVGFRLSPQMRTHAELLASQLGMSISELARKALAEYLASHASQSDMLNHYE